MGKYITIKDNAKKINQSLENIRKITGATLRIGVIGEDSPSYEDDISMPELAAVHEFGVTIKVTDKMRGWFWAHGYHVAKDTIEIPERSFIRRAFDKNKSEIRKVASDLLEKAIRGDITAKSFMDKLGVYLVGLVHETINAVEKPPLSTMTKEMRTGKSGGESPLQDTGKLWQAIDYEVEW